MDKVYDHSKYEQKIYEMWEKAGAFTPKINKTLSAGKTGKKPYCIILPLPNASDPMHMGHALFTIEDILIRYHRMLGDATLWLPGGDHAGIETQYVFEKKLAKEGKSRFDYDRKTLYQMIKDFTDKNRDINKDQMKRLGFSMDWSRYHYSLEPEIIEKVLATFRQLYKDGLIYRANRMVNFCTKCGTAFSDLEIEHVERLDPLYYLKYGPFVLATTRPETKFGDTAVAYHPGDKRYEKYLGQEIEIQGVNGPFAVKVVADSEIDPDFGTGIEKVTPAHDFLDNEIAKRHKLPIKTVIDLNGRLTSLAGRFEGLKVNAAREAVVAEMKKINLIDHVDEKYTHSISVCYRCKTTIEPMLMPQWYVKTKPLAKPAIAAVKKGLTKIVPRKRFEKMYFDWMENIQDWNISRQIVWGPRIPAWYCLGCNPDITVNFINQNGERINDSFSELKEKYSFDEIKNGLQSLSAPVSAEYSIENTKSCAKCGGNNLLQETDTFDTWFLSAQWPMNTLGFPNSPDFEYFYPTSVLDTLWDILFFWVARMMMLGIYRTGKVPFKVVHLHARVVDKLGQKMSKSKGNVINPLEMIDKYGADALRMALVYGVSPASDVVMTDDKVRSMRNFANKVWNIGRFLSVSLENKKDIPFYSPQLKGLKTDDEKIIKSLESLIKKTTANLEKYRFDFAIDSIYQFIWHELADNYLEHIKTRIQNNETAPLSILRHVYLHSLMLLHPFMPLLTEIIWQEIKNLRKYPEDSLITTLWPGMRH